MSYSSAHFVSLKKSAIMLSPNLFLCSSYKLRKLDNMVFIFFVKLKKIKGVGLHLY